MSQVTRWLAGWAGYGDLDDGGKLQGIWPSLPVSCAAVCIRVLQPPPTPPYTAPPPLSTHTRPNPGPLTAIAPLIMAELRVGSVPLAATDASWKTHMSQVRAQRELNHKPLNHKPQTTSLKPQTTNHKPQTTNRRPPTNPQSEPLPLQVSHIGTWQDGSFGGDALDDNLIVDGWDRCARMRCLCLSLWSILLWLYMRL